MQIPTGEDIRAARLKKGLTQSELAEKAGVSQPLIARIESSDVDPTVDTLYGIVSALNGSSSEVEQKDVKISMPSVLKEARKRTGYTQGELADAAGVSQPLISRIERQDVNPRSSTLRSLFNHLDPVTTSSGTASSTSETQDGDLLARIEQDFEEFSEPSERSKSGKDNQDRERDRCPECDTDIAVYPDPSYCPDCGTEL